MAKIELDATSTVGIGVQTNIALFGLSIRMKSGDVVPILDQTSRIFVSGGNMLVNPRNGDTEDISSKRKRYRDDLTAQEEKLKKSKQEIIRFTGKVLEDTGNPEQSSQDFLERLKFVQKNEHAMTQAKTSIETLEAEAETYAPSIFAKNPSRYKKDFINAIYDPEQTITRIVDYLRLSRL